MCEEPSFSYPSTAESRPTIILDEMISFRRMLTCVLRIRINERLAHYAPAKWDRCWHGLIKRPQG